MKNRKASHNILLLWYSLIVVIVISAYAAIYSCSSLTFNDANNRDIQGIAFPDCLYFSVVTLTTLGYGEITPTNGIAKLTAASEAMFGLILFGAILHLSFNAIELRKNRILANNALDEAIRYLAQIGMQFRRANGNDEATREVSYYDHFDELYDLLTDVETGKRTVNYSDDILSEIFYSLTVVRANIYRLLAFSDCIGAETNNRIDQVAYQIDHLIPYHKYENYTDNDKARLVGAFRGIFAALQPVATEYYGERKICIKMNMSESP